MALTVSTGTASGRSNDVWGASKITKLRVTFDSAYPAGGEVFAPATYHQGPVDAVFVSGPRVPVASRGRVAVDYDHTNGKLTAFGTGDVATEYEELTGCDLATLVVDVLIVSH